MFDNETRQEVIDQLREEFPEVVAILQHCQECALEEMTFKDLQYALSRNLDRRAGLI